tara:strand:+ start:595 stop:738 length:144 start_codon:yes stop_codon:yes gene_type:complete
MAGKKKKGKVAIVIALNPMGGKAPKKPEDTSKVGVEKKATNKAGYGC